MGGPKFVAGGSSERRRGKCFSLANTWYHFINPWLPWPLWAKKLQGQRGPQGSKRQGVEEEKGCKGCMDVTAQPLKAEAMPLHRRHGDDFTTTVTPLDPAPSPPPTQCTPQTPPPLIAAAGSHWTAIDCRGSRKKRRRDGRKEGSGEIDGEQQDGPMEKVNCWSEVFIGIARGREWENVLKTTVWDFNNREGNLAFFHPYTRLTVRWWLLSRSVCEWPNG